SVHHDAVDFVVTAVRRRLNHLHGDGGRNSSQILIAASVRCDTAPEQIDLPVPHPPPLGSPRAVLKRDSAVTLFNGELDWGDWWRRESSMTRSSSSSLAWVPRLAVQ